ncbi:thiol reductase thioredoxin [Methanofervidicoccus sp. A16]|uniref:thioredoxin family protein n=1 Tax=Methanofervidicoccus sp. A16 TaxID=2607662 RepID=UPI00118B625A|nr:thioredoxin family protein [Methanofervidicoccus sp. A16]AXI24858.1 thiol reductase thioredoxin [Methanofervidicoccus sp. A16]
MKTYLLLILLSITTILSGCIDFGNSEYNEVLIKDLNLEGKTAIVVFHADWCKYCKDLEPTLNQLEKEGVEVIRIDVDERRELAEKLGIRGLPTVIYVKDGVVVGRTIGYDPEGIVNKARELYQ